MAEIYGMKVAKDLVHISGDTSDYHLEGFVANLSILEVINITFLFSSMVDTSKTLYSIKQF